VDVGDCDGVKKYVEAYRLVKLEPCSSFDVSEADSYTRFFAQIKKL